MSAAYSYVTSVHYFDDGGELHMWEAIGRDRDGFWRFIGGGTACTAEDAEGQAKAYIKVREDYLRFARCATVC